MNEDELLYKMIFEEVVKRYTNQNFNVRKLLHEQNGLSGLISLEKLHKFFSQNKFDVEEFLNKNGMDINIGLHILHIHMEMKLKKIHLLMLVMI